MSDVGNTVSRSSMATGSFRLFFSSTFADWSAERNYLQVNIWPGVAKFCRSRGFGFQVIDLRWGISRQAQEEAGVMDVCLAEVERCHRLSPRPNFLICIGDRYGYCPLPDVISDNDFQAILQAAHPEQKLLLVGNDAKFGCYRKDTNAVQVGGVWVLNRERRVDAETLRGALYACTAGWSEEDRMRVGIGVSATELEYRAAEKYINELGDPLVVSRRFTGMDVRAAETSAHPYLDVVSGGDGWERNPVAAAAIERFRSKALQKAVVVADYELPWEERNSETYLARLGEQIRVAVTAAIERSAPEREEPSLLTQKLVHKITGCTFEEVELINAEGEKRRRQEEESLRHFTGRADILEKLTTLAKSTTGCRVALIGAPGSGKSAVMAGLAHELKEHKVTLVFAGRTRHNTQEESVMRLLTAHIRLYSHSAGVNREQTAGAVGEATLEAFTEMTSPLERKAEPHASPREMLRQALAGSTERVIVLVDAVDQITTGLGDPAELSWLGMEWPANAALIVSCGEEAAGRLPASFRREVIPPLQPAEARRMCESHLAAAGRSLTTEQWRALEDRFADCPLPLYVFVAAQDAVHGHSFVPAAPMPSTLPGLLRRILDRLASPERHGATLLRRTLSYLLNARHGLAEDEWLSLASDDDDIWAELQTRSHHQIPQRQIPDAIWSRLVLDLQPWLRESVIDGYRMIQLFSPLFAQICVDYCYSNSEERRSTHLTMADFFARRLAEIAESSDPSEEDINALLSLPEAHQRPVPEVVTLRDRYLKAIAWHLFRAQAWSRLGTFLASGRFLRSLWKLNGLGPRLEVVEFWRRIQRECGLQATACYAELLARCAPASFDGRFIVWLYEQLGFDSEALAAIERFLPECRRTGAIEAHEKYLLIKVNLHRERGESEKAKATITDLLALQRENYTAEGHRRRLEAQAAELGAPIEDLLKFYAEDSKPTLDPDYAIVSSLEQQALVAHSEGRLDDAMVQYRRIGEIYRQAWEIRGDDSDRCGYGVALRNQGVVSLYQGCFTEAASFLDEALGHFRASGSSAPLIEALNRRAEVHMATGDFHAIIPTLEEAVRLLMHTGTCEELFQTLGRLCELMMNLDEKKRAISLIGELVEEARLRGDDIRRGECERAFARCISPVVMGGPVKAEVACAEGMMGRGLLYFEQDRFQEAIPVLEEAEKIFRAMGNSRDAQVCLNRRSISMRCLNQQPSREMLRQEAIDMFSKFLKRNRDPD